MTIRVKKLILTIAFIFLTIPGFTTFAYAGGPISVQESTEVGIQAEVVEKRYRVHNGIVQYRRWSVTYGRWVDPYWINL